MTEEFSLEPYILSFDPKHSNKDMFILEVMFREVTITGEPIIIPGLFMFSRQNTVSISTILDMLIEANPAFARAALVMSDGCDTFGRELEGKVKFAFHGVDRNHVEKNIVNYIKYEMGLTESTIKKWKRTVYQFLRGDKTTTHCYGTKARKLLCAYYASGIVGGFQLSRNCDYHLRRRPPRV